MKGRLNKVRSMLKEQQIDAYLVTKPENRMYLSGFSGSSGMLYITETQALLLTDFRYVEQAGEQATLFEVVQHATPAIDTLNRVIMNSKAQRIGFEENHLTVQQFNEFNRQIHEVEWIPANIDKFRRVKNEDEVAILRKSAAIADEAFLHILSFIRPGVCERDISLELDVYMRKMGAEKNAFDFIVASGVRSALPHGLASSKLIQTGEMVTLDFGCVFQHYHSDITRTVAVGEVPPTLQHIYRVVAQAQQAVLEAIRPGLKCAQVDKIARDMITAHGYGQYFGHGLGHGVGLAIHEEPRLAPSDDTILEPGMIVTVEPGIYIPDLGGVRIEDMILITANGCETLAHSSKDFIQL
jgi:Xaa-Pro aminopeptidase